MPLNPINVNSVSDDTVASKKPFVTVLSPTSRMDIRNPAIKEILNTSNVVSPSPSQLFLKILSLCVAPMMVRLGTVMPIRTIWDKETGLKYGPRFLIRLWTHVMGYIVLSIASIAVLSTITCVSLCFYAIIHPWRMGKRIVCRIFNLIMNRLMGFTIEFDEKVSQFYSGFSCKQPDIVNVACMSYYYRCGNEWRRFLAMLDSCLEMLDSKDDMTENDHIFLTEVTMGSGRQFIDSYIQRSAYASELTTECVCAFDIVANDIMSIYNKVCIEVSNLRIHNGGMCKVDRDQPMNVLMVRQGLNTCKYLHSVVSTLRAIGVRTIVSDSDSLIPLLYSITYGEAFCVFSFFLEQGVRDTSELVKFLYNNSTEYFNIWVRQRLERLFNSSLKEFCDINNVDIYVYMTCPQTGAEWYFSNKNTPNVELADLCVYALASEGFVFNERLSNGICRASTKSDVINVGEMLVFGGSVTDLVEANSTNSLYKCVFDCSIYRSVFWWMVPGVMKSFNTNVCVGRLSNMICRGYIYSYNLVRNIINDMKYDGSILRILDSDFNIIPEPYGDGFLRVVPSLMDIFNGEMTNERVIRYIEARNPAAKQHHLKTQD